MTIARKLLGAKGEHLAEKMLLKKGFKRVARNLRNKAGEIDLLMWDKDELVIVEVRTIDHDRGDDPSNRIPVSKRRQLVRLAHHLLAELDDPLPTIRFDACVVIMNPSPSILHYEDAFNPDDVHYQE